MAKKLNLQILILVGLECIKINKDLFYDLFKVGFFQPFLFFSHPTNTISPFPK